MLVNFVSKLINLLASVGWPGRSHKAEKGGDARHDANTKKIDDIIRNIQRD